MSKFPNFNSEYIKKSIKKGLRTLLVPHVANRETPGADINLPKLTEEQKQHSARLMRVNHCGEVCAQALYQGQALFSRDKNISTALQEAANEEIDHLSWTAERINELEGKTSILNPVWFAGSFVIGATTALISDNISLGFVAETETQVSKHLQSHLDKLPLEDEKSREIIKQMDIDEQQHATHAMNLGGTELPDAVKGTMRILGKIMTKTSYWL